MPKPLVEQTSITEAAAAAAKKTGRMMIQFISPGWGSSGYYSSDVLEQAVTDRVIPKGTHMYADHPTDSEDVERPGRSIKDLMAVTVEDATLSAEGALVGPVDVVPAWRDLVEVAKDSIGVSIRGSATDIVEGEADGRRGGLIEGLVAPVLSVDFVTKAGRGGKVLEVLESAATNQRALEHGVAEATVNDTREALQTALRDAHATAKDVWLYVRDFDDATVWFEIDGSGAGDTAGIYGQAYTEADGAVTLTGDRAEVRVVTKYVPVARPDITTPTTESEEDTMPKIQIEEADHKRLVDEAGRVPTLEQERDTEKARGDNAEARLAEHERRDAAMDLIREHEHGFKPLEVKGLVAELPLKESGEFDADAFKTQLDEHAAAAKVAGGAGRISGMGTVTDAPATTTESSAPSKTAWGRPLNEQKGA